MRTLAGALLAAVLAVSCAQPVVFSDLVGCLAVPGQDPPASLLPALVDRADAVAQAQVTRVEPINNGHPGAAKVTLRVVEMLKGTVGAQIVVLDAPCPLIGAKDGEAMVVFIDGAPRADGSVALVNMPVGVVRGSAARPLAQILANLRAIRPVDGEARALLERYGWTVTAKQSVGVFDLPARSEFPYAGREIAGVAPSVNAPFARYAELSADVGLDLAPAAGRPAELLTFWLERTPPEFRVGAPFGHVLIADRRIIGAWVTVFAELGPFSIRDRAGALAATARTGRWTPPPNRAPQGINITRTYELGSTRSLAYKSGGGSNGDISDPLKVRAFVDALDELLPTTQAVFRPSDSPPTKYYLHFFQAPDRHLSVEYSSADGTLSIIVDGIAVKAPARFAALVADLR